MRGTPRPGDDSLVGLMTRAYNRQPLQHDTRSTLIAAHINGTKQRESSAIHQMCCSLGETGLLLPEPKAVARMAQQMLATSCSIVG
jgi:hypothetical protein